MPDSNELVVSSLGPGRHASPLLAKRRRGFVDDATRVLVSVELSGDGSAEDAPAYEKAGPRERIFFDPARTTAAFVTCGGLSPGLNNVLRSAYHELRDNYGVERILGIRNGYRGLDPAVCEPPVLLDDRTVERIHLQGGTILGTSRGPRDPEVVVDTLVERDIDLLFCIGGDGTQRGAHGIAEEIRKRGLEKALVGIPKTIDNDIAHVFPSFGYATALETAAEVIQGAHAEATAVKNGVTLVKLMGRDAGYIAAGAALVSQDADFVLVPEVPFPLDGPQGLLESLAARVEEQGHAVVLVAEGAGRQHFEELPEERDASGNLRQNDIGPFLRERIAAHFASRELELGLRYIDPSYTIRSLPANAWDRILCDMLARDAVHAAMAGKTDVMIGYRMGALYHVPIPAVVGNRVRMDLDGEIWTSVLASTGQPSW